VSPIECSGLEVAGRTLDHDVLPVQTHQSLFRVPAPVGSGSSPRWERDDTYPLSVGVVLFETS